MKHENKEAGNTGFPRFLSPLPFYLMKTPKTTGRENKCQNLIMRIIQNIKLLRHFLPKRKIFSIYPCEKSQEAFFQTNSKRVHYWDPYHNTTTLN